jgi:hypothetical protein
MTDIYHITHIDNLPLILQEGGLWCDAEVTKRKLTYTRIGYSHLKNDRALVPVPVSARGHLSDYVPFYFCPRSPMLYAIYGGYVIGYRGGQVPILHFRASTEAVNQARLRFAFTDGHAKMAISHFYEDLAQLDQLDWEVIRAWSWHDTQLDNDRQRRKQAEFLVSNFFPWNLIEEIGVINREIKAQVEKTIDKAAHKPIVKVHPEWYYD